MARKTKALKALVVIAILVSSALTSSAQPSVIFDTDIGPDYDDVGALAMLHAFADKKECKILGTIACNKHEYIVGVLDIMNAYFKRPNLPIGILKGEGLNLRS